LIAVDSEAPSKLDRAHLDSCHERRIQRRQNLAPDADFDTLPPSWFADQCGGCRYFIPMTGLFSSDWGVCSQRTAVKDGQVVFEHDGCDQFEDAGKWDFGKAP